MVPQYINYLKLQTETESVLSAAAAADGQAQPEMFSIPGLPQGFGNVQHSCSLLFGTQISALSAKGSDATKPARVIKL